MAYDETLAARIRAALGGEDVVEKRAIGGLAFMVGGNMAVSASGRGGLLVRADPARFEEYRAAGAQTMEMGGRTMGPGWLYLPPDAVADDADLARWVEVGRAYARSLPAK